MTKSAQGPIAVITGGARGIGQATATLLHHNGYRVVLADVRREQAEDVARELGAGAYARALDVTDAESVGALIDEVERTLGPIAVWINNAGVLPAARFASQDLTHAESAIEVNYKGVLSCTRQVLPRMLARQSGHVVNVASATAAHPIAGLAVYSGTKAAVLGFSRALRRELRGTGVALSVVLPYVADTAMGAGIPAQPGFRAVTPDEVARRVLEALRTRGFVFFVPHVLGYLIGALNLLPFWLRDRIDDLLAADAIGLGGDHRARKQYESEVMSDVNS